MNPERAPEKVYVGENLRKAKLLAMTLALRSARLLLVQHRALFKRPGRIRKIDHVIHQIDTALGD